WHWFLAFRSHRERLPRLDSGCGDHGRVRLEAVPAEGGTRCTAGVADWSGNVFTGRRRRREPCCLKRRCTSPTRAWRLACPAMIGRYAYEASIELAATGDFYPLLLAALGRPRHRDPAAAGVPRCA